jgi:hypothetical protein
MIGDNRATPGQGEGVCRRIGVGISFFPHGRRKITMNRRQKPIFSFPGSLAPSVSGSAVRVYKRST